MTRHSAPEPTPYDIIWPASFAAKLKTLDSPRLADAVTSFVWTELRFDPTEFGDYGRKLRGELSGMYSAKQKQFRVIYEFDEASRTITLMDVKL